MKSSTCRATHLEGRAAGRAYGLAEGGSAILARLLHRQAKERFKANPAGKEFLTALADGFALDQLNELGTRLFSATGWDDWLSGITPPPRVSGPPEYTKNLEMDFEPTTASIDTHMAVDMPPMGKTYLHFRIQKWYQPNLDLVLYEESCRNERKYKKMPVVVVVLMSPPVEGPGMTGRYEDRDSSGKVRQTFTYQIRRAWEESPEEMANNCGTLMLAPLGRGSRERLPEIVGMMKKTLEKQKADEKVVSASWNAAYWALGFIFSTDEAHAALGEVWDYIQSTKDYQSALGHGFMESYPDSLKEGELTVLRELIESQLTVRFGASPEIAPRLASIPNKHTLEALGMKVLSVPDLPTFLSSISG